MSVPHMSAGDTGHDKDTEHGRRSAAPDRYEPPQLWEYGSLRVETTGTGNNTWDGGAGNIS